MKFEDILALSDQELIEFYDISNDTPNDLRAQLKNMSTYELVNYFDIKENQTPRNLRKTLLALSDEDLLEAFDIRTPAQIREDLENFRCLDCKKFTDHEYYMILHDLWDSIADDGMLCIGCLEDRLGRRLTPEDFTDAPVNQGPDSRNRTARLNDRLGYDITKSIDYQEKELSVSPSG